MNAKDRLSTCPILALFSAIPTQSATMLYKAFRYYFEQFSEELPKTMLRMQDGMEFLSDMIPEYSGRCQLHTSATGNGPATPHFYKYTG